MTLLLHIILSIVISTSIDSTSLWIGDQCQMHLEAICLPGEQVSLPVYGEELIPGIQVVRRTAIDTLAADEGRIRIQQHLTLTSITDSLYYIPPQPFVLGAGDTMWSNSMTLNIIQPFILDSTNAVTDIKAIAKAPIWWWGIIRWILLALLIGLLVGALIWYIRYHRQHRDTAAVVPTEPERPAEEIALEKLALIKEEKVWQQGKTKEYHTELTDVIREYIGRRFDIHSSEKTSDETLQAMKPEMAEQKELYGRLEKMLRLADLVKFAKWTTTPDENESSLRTAYDFVNETTVNHDIQ